MKTQKRLLLAGLAVAIALFAVSASSASAAVWKDGGVNVAKAITIGLTGRKVRTERGNGMSCGTHLTLTTEGGSTGKITKYEPGTCKGFGTFAACEVVTAEAKGLPWTVDVNTTDLTITNWHTKRTFKNCATTELDKTIAEHDSDPEHSHRDHRDGNPQRNRGSTKPTARSPSTHPTPVHTGIG